MKLSKFNLFWKWDNGLDIAYNSFTTALAEVDSNFFYILNNLDKIKFEELDSNLKSIYDNMKRGGFIIDDEMDEIKFLKYNQQLNRFSESNLGLTLAPTLACNFACDYCYENAKPGVMSDDTLNKIEEMVKDKIKTIKALHITWYGGEPLLVKDIVFNFSKRLLKLCEENKITCSVSMVTNGYLLDQETIDKLKEIKVSAFQITLDGPPSIHNARRKLKNSSEGTFEKILNNIKLLKENKMNLAIRINADKTNYDKVDEVFDILQENGLDDIGVYIGHVNDYTEACRSISGHCFNSKEFAELDLKTTQKLFDRGFGFDLFHYFFPGLHANYCSADQINSFVIDPKGNLYKCWNDVGVEERAVGNLDKKVEITNKMQMTKINYMEWDPFDFKDCKECKLIPVCMGGCPFEGLRNQEPKCEKWKFVLDDILKFTYKYQMAKKEKERIENEKKEKEKKEIEKEKKEAVC